jgi:hypothetical protein
MGRLENALEIGLRRLAEGETIEEALADAPELRSEVTPLLRAAITARRAAETEFPIDLRQRVRLRFLHRAAQMRKTPRHRQARIIPAFSRAAITLILAAILVLTSTGLVRASSRAVPGDQLYTVKRSWEDIRLLLSTQPAVQYMLASEFEQERLDEIEELLNLGRTAPITFSGVISFKSDGSWIVSGIPVYIAPTAKVPAESIIAGQPVLVSGTTRADGTVEASDIQLLLPGAALPPLGPSAQVRGLSLETPHAEESQDAAPDRLPSGAPPTYTTYEFTGIVERLGTAQWQVNQQQVDVTSAVVVGAIKVGSEIKFEGYYAPDGSFIATRIEATANLHHDDGRKEHEAGSSAQPSEGGDAGGDSHDGEGQPDG